MRDKTILFLASVGPYAKWVLLLLSLVAMLLGIGAPDGIGTGGCGGG